MSLFYDWVFVLQTQLVLFFALWLFSYFSSKISWVDFFWSSSIGTWTIFLVFQKKTWEPGPMFFLAAVIVFWSLRLSTHLFRRLSSHQGEDRRYQEIKNSSGLQWKQKSLIIFGMNALLTSLLLLPVLVSINSKASTWTGWGLMGGGLSLISILGEAIADYQLGQHVLKNTRSTLMTGLWKYSRHPNYFFEWLFWVGIALSVLDLENGYLGLIAPILMYLFLNFFTGVKISEQNAEKRRADFKAYKDRTSAFFLLPPKN